MLTDTIFTRTHGSIRQCRTSRTRHVRRDSEVEFVWFSVLTFSIRKLIRVAAFTVVYCPTQNDSVLENFQHVYERQVRRFYLLHSTASRVTRRDPFRRLA